ncbi:MAG: hypothetical protein AAGJ46_16475 [Planctomycetota bacterium]
MSVGPIGGVLSSAAGAPLSQTAGSETERAKTEGASQARERDATQKAEKSSGVGQTQEDQGASDRDADGRRMWEAPEDTVDIESTGEEQSDTDAAPTLPTKESKDATGEAGNSLDLTV